MMEKILETCTNPFVVVPLLAWAFAQVLKVIINYAVTKELNFERLFGDGGMPSGHSATVSSMATMAFMAFAFDSAEISWATTFNFFNFVAHKISPYSKYLFSSTQIILLLPYAILTTSYNL